MTQKPKIWKKYEVFTRKKDIFYNSFWLNKFVGKFIKQGKKYIVEKNFNKAFGDLKTKFQKYPGVLFLHKLIELQPVMGCATKRVGRKYHTVPLPIRPRRRQILSLVAITKYTKTLEARCLSHRMISGLSDVFGEKKSYIVKKNADFVKSLSENRMYLRLRWK